MGAPPGGTPLDIAAVIDRVLRRNINWPFRALVDGASVVTLLDHYLTVDATAGAATVTLPSAVTAQAGMPFEVMRIDSALANSVTFAAPGGQTINGAPSVTITTQYGVLTFVSDGANWLMFASPSAFAVSTDVLWTFPDQVSVDQNSNLYTLQAARAFAFVGVDATLNVAPTGGSLIVDWEVNGVVDPNLQIVVPAGTDYFEVLFPFALAIGDTLHPIVSQVGSLTPGITMVMRARGQ